MRRGMLFAAAACLALLPCQARAARLKPRPVPPVVHDGVRYVAPNRFGPVGYVEAWDVKSGNKPWEQTIYEVTIDDSVEADVQWVFITKLEIADDKLIITNGRYDRYSLDLKTRKVMQLPDVSAFALDLYARLRTGEGNVFLSPLSISTALGMTQAGARGETAKEMAAVLHLPADQTEAHAALGTLLANLNSLGKVKGCRLSIANALWGQKDCEFLPDFLERVRKDYGAGLERVDFMGDTEGARKTINTWVEKKTEDRIRDLIPPGALDPLTRLVLTNAIYFKGDWGSQFDRKLTADAPFTVSTDTKVTVPMMHRKAEFGYASGTGFQALELPYVGDALSMVIFLPDKADGLPEFESSLSREDLGWWLDRLRAREVDVYLPRFRATLQYELGDTLKEMGMSGAFSSGADFSGMTGRRDVFISNVIHKAFVDVNEEGTEAAAATAVIMTRGPAPAPPPVFRADHPFLFLIRDRTTGSILFLGRVVNPNT